MKGYIVTISAVAVCLAWAQAAFATTFVNRPLGEIVKETSVIARGRTGESYSEWDKSGRKQIFTYTYFTVTEVLKGDLKKEKIVLRQPGGGKDGIEMSVPGTANFVPEEDVVVMIGDYNDEDDSYDVPGFATGKYNVVQGPNGEPMLENSLGGGAVYDANKDPRTMSYNSKIPLEVFRRVAKGEDIPEAAHRQYKGSRDQPPPHVYDADHHKHVAPEVRPSATPTPERSVNAEAVDEPQKKGIWIPLSFAVIAALGAVVLWRLLRKES